MTIYNVHLYREMRLTFEAIEADTPDAATAIARDKPSSDADDIVLTGTVATVGEIERATAIVRAVQGVHDVRNQILLG